MIKSRFLLLIFILSLFAVIQNTKAVEIKKTTYIIAISGLLSLGIGILKHPSYYQFLNKNPSFNTCYYRYVVESITLISFSIATFLNTLFFSKNTSKKAILNYLFSIIAAYLGYGNYKFLDNEIKKNINYDYIICGFIDGGLIGIGTGLLSSTLINNIG